MGCLLVGPFPVYACRAAWSINAADRPPLARKNRLPLPDGFLHFNRANLRGRHREEGRVLRPGFDGAVVGKPGDVVEAEVVGAVLVDLGEEGGGGEVTRGGRIVGPLAVPFAPIALLRAEESANLHRGGNAAHGEAALQVRVAAPEVLLMVAVGVRRRGREAVIADVVDIEFAVGVVEDADARGVVRRDALEGHADRIKRRDVELVEAAVLVVTAPGLGGREVRARVDLPRSVVEPVTRVGGQGARRDMDEV